MKTILNAGHYYDACAKAEDTGAISGVHIESRMAITLRDVIAQKFDAVGRKYIKVPDNLNVTKSIEFVNKKVSEDDILVELHFNIAKSPTVRGCETYYYRQQYLAKVFAEKVSKALSIPNRGYFPDDKSQIGQIDLLRKTKCKSVLIEVCFLSSPEDIKVLNYDKVAQGILEALDEFDSPITATAEAPKHIRVLTVEEKAKVNFLWDWLEKMKLQLKMLGAEQGEYSLTQKANVITFLVSLAALGGVYITETDINGFLVTIGALATVVASMVSFWGRFRAGGINIFGRRV